MNGLKSFGNRSWGVWCRKATQVLIGGLALLLLSLPAFSQGSSARILGTVTDQSGGVVAGAMVSVVDTERGVTRTLTTDDAGEYNAPNLTPGSYLVRAEAAGFKKIERAGVVLEVGKEVRVDLTVQPGEQAQTVTVTESVPLVETSNATLGGTLNNADINDMPLNGRNYQNLLTLRPGVTAQPGGGPWTQSSNGVRPDESGWMVDGIINANFYDSRPIANMPSPFTDGATILPIDAIQEFNLEENPKAELGWKPGAVVNVGIKSGTNSLHGTAYAFGRSDVWDARNAFTPAPVNGVCLAAIQAACNKLPTQLKQFGGVVGGPIKKDKLFFLAGYEGLRSFVGNAIVTGGVPSNVAQTTPNPTLSMVDAINTIIGTPGLGVSALSPVSLALAGCTVTPAVSCTGGLWPANPGSNKSFTSNFPNTNTSDNGIGKIDYHINDKNNISGLFLEGHYTNTGEDHPFVNAAFEDHSPITTYTASGSWDWVPNSRLVNEIRFGYNRVNFDFFSVDSTVASDGSGLTGGAGYPINTGITSLGGLPNINLTGFEKLGTWHNRPYYFKNPYYDGQDSVSYLMGKHTLKFGVEIAHIEVDSASYDAGRGRIDFQGGQTAAISGSTPLEDFFAGNPSRGFILTGNATRTSTWMSYAGFAEDDWRLSQKITLNLGLRYSYVSPVAEANGLFGSFVPNVGMVSQSALGGTLWKPDTKDFSPRLGFAWDVTGKGTTVVRGGFNIMYSVLTIATLLQEGSLQNSTALSVAAVPTGACNVAVPVGETCTQAGGTSFGGSNTLAVTKVPSAALNWNGTVFPTGVVPSCTSGSPCNIMTVDPNLTTPYVMAWNFGITHAFTPNFSLEVEYVGSHGARLTGFTDLNQPNGQGAYPLASKTDSLGNPMTYLGYVDQLSNDGRSNYNGLQTTLTKRLSHGISFTAGYSYSHALDNGSLNRQGFLPQNSLNPGAEYSSGDFDVRHRFTFTTTYDIPGMKGYAQMLEGWKLNSIITIQSGQPWTVWDTANNFDVTGTGDNNYRWDFSGNPADFQSQGANSIPYCIAGSCTVTSGIFGQTGPVLANSAAMWATCQADTNSMSNLTTLGCFVSPNGKSAMTPPATGSFGDMGRNTFRDHGFKNVDFSVFKNFTFKERYSAQFRVEFFNLFNHPNYANPYGSVAGWGVGNDPGGQQSTFGCGCATPDVMAGNPLVGSGSARTMQLGLKLGF
jgi:hypothetical protein